MTIVFEILLLIGFSMASFYIGYRYSIDFNSKLDQPYNSLDDIENTQPRKNLKQQYSAR